MIDVCIELYGKSSVLGLYATADFNKNLCDFDRSSKEKMQAYIVIFFGTSIHIRTCTLHISSLLKGRFHLEQLADITNGPNLHLPIRTQCTDKNMIDSRKIARDFRPVKFVCQLRILSTNNAEEG